MSKINLPTFTMRQLLEAGVHFGHNTRRWNPKMEQYIFGTRHNVHVIDLQKTVPMLYQALEVLVRVAENGGRILFVGTKRQASEIIAESARKSAQHFVNHRWLGGMLTNWNTVSKSIGRLKELDEVLADEENSGLTKKELLNLTREREKLELALGGIRELGGTPDLLFVIDTQREHIAVSEAKKLGIPVIGVIDTNCDPDDIDYPIPGNDDAMRAIQLYCDLVRDAILEGIRREMGRSGMDVGAMEQPPAEKLKTGAKKEDKKEDKAESKDKATPAKKKPAAKAKKADSVKKSDSKADDKAAANESDNGTPEEKKAASA